MNAAKTPQGFERVKLHTSDGHEYTAMIVAGVTESEWQATPPAYMKSHVPSVATLEDYNTLRQELQTSRQDTLQN
jgi:hypothetical protein